MAIAAILIVTLLAFGNMDDVSFEASQPDYMSKVFDKDKVSEINIIIDEDKWQELLDNAIKEEYYICDISINGEVFSNVGIRAKGNSSLNMVANSSSDRYSFKIDFNEYIDGQSYYGLDKLALNNNISDATYMKEYLSYDMFSEIGVPTPGYAYSNIKVNGQDWGLYLAVEVMEESFIERYYGSVKGNLYKPEGMEIGGGKGFNNEGARGNRIEPDFRNMQGQLPNNMSIQPPNDAQGRMPNNMFGGRMGRSNSTGTNLVYTDDNISSYSGIFDNAIFKSTNDEDKKNLINILKNLNDSTDLDKYIDVDEVLRYFAVNTFLVNLDSYAGSLKHNYYLYELDGKLQILPWDFNLSFAGHEMSDGSKAINFPIDAPVSDTMENSPLISKLLEVDSYKDLYHQYLEKLVNEYINSGKYETSISKVNDLIADYVKNDATAFYTYDQYEKSLPVLLQFGKDRSDSIIAQLNGQQPATAYGTLATTVDLSALGSMDRGMGNKGEARTQIEKQGDNGFKGLMQKNNNAMGFRSPHNIKQNRDRTDTNFRPNPLNFEGAAPVSNSGIVKTPLLLIGGSILALILAYVFVAKFKRRKYNSKDLLK